MSLGDIHEHTQQVEQRNANRRKKKKKIEFEGQKSISEKLRTFEHSFSAICRLRPEKLFEESYPRFEDSKIFGIN